MFASKPCECLISFQNKFNQTKNEKQKNCQIYFITQDLTINTYVFSYIWKNLSNWIGYIKRKKSLYKKQITNKIFINIFFFPQTKWSFNKVKLYERFCLSTSIYKTKIFLKLFLCLEIIKHNYGGLPPPEKST